MRKETSNSWGRCMSSYISKIRCGLLNEVDAYVIRLNSVIMLKCYLLPAGNSHLWWGLPAELVATCAL